MTTATAPIRSRRLGPGYYEVDTPLGTFEVVKVETAPEWRGRGYGAADWHVTWPGERTPDATVATKREALDLIEAELD